MNTDFSTANLGNSGIPVHRMGLAATYRPGKAAIHEAIDRGVNFVFCYGFDTQAMSVVRDVLKAGRKDIVVATGAYNLIWGHTNLRRTLEKRLRKLGTDHIDVFLFLGVTKRKHLTDEVKSELVRFREEGKVRCIGISGHDRRFHAELATEGVLDTMMMRYNAAHRGAEEEIFPHLQPHNPGVISYTATRWSYLLRRPKNWPKGERVPTAAMCYRFVLSNPNVDVCLTAPSNVKQLRENLAAIEAGPLSDEDMQFMRTFGDAVHAQKKYFM